MGKIGIALKLVQKGVALVGKWAIQNPGQIVDAAARYSEQEQIEQLNEQINDLLSYTMEIQETIVTFEKEYLDYQKKVKIGFIVMGVVSGASMALSVIAMIF